MSSGDAIVVLKFPENCRRENLCVEGAANAFDASFDWF